MSRSFFNKGLGEKSISMSIGDRSALCVDVLGIPAGDNVGIPQVWSLRTK